MRIGPPVNKCSCIIYWYPFFLPSFHFFVTKFSSTFHQHLPDLHPYLPSCPSSWRPSPFPSRLYPGSDLSSSDPRDPATSTLTFRDLRSWDPRAPETAESCADPTPWWAAISSRVPSHVAPLALSAAPRAEPLSEPSFPPLSPLRSFWACAICCCLLGCESLFLLNSSCNINKFDGFFF